MTITPLPPIDPLAGAGPGRYRDLLVDVARSRSAPSHAVRTPSFAFWTDDHVVHLVHDLADHEIDNDVAGRLAQELFSPGWLSGSDVFERLVTGVVVSAGETPLTAWELFYRNTLRRLAALLPPVSAGTRGSQHLAPEGSLTAYAPVYARALDLVEPGSVLEVGSCFGFFALLLSGHRDVTATDVTPNTVRLLAAVAPRLGFGLHTLICDAALVPRSDASYDTVVALHLLEHLPPEHGAAVLAEMQRLAARRVVVAVPFEDEPTAAYGHVRTFCLDDLVALGRASGWAWRVDEHHGGWLVLDRPGPAVR